MRNESVLSMLRPWGRHVFLACCLVMTAFVVVYQLVHLTRYPVVFIDEPWYANAAWNWLTTGRNFDSIHAGAREEVVWPLVGNLPLVASFKALGLGLFQARLVSWLFGIVLLCLMIIVGKRLFSKAAGVLGALLLSLSFPFIQASHYARPDIFLAVMALLCYFLTLCAFEKERRWMHLLAGILIVLSVDIHQNAILVGIGLLSLYPVNYGYKFFSKSGTWMFALGAFAGAACYLTLLYISGVGDSANYYRSTLASTHRLPVVSMDILDLLRSFRAELGRYHFAEQDVDFVLIGASVAYLLFRRTKRDVLNLVFLGAIFCLFVLCVGNKHDIYAIILYPFLILMTSDVLMSQLSKKGILKSETVFIIALMCLVVFTKWVVLSRKIDEAKGYDYYASTERMRRVIPADARVMGLPNWWLGLSDYDYRSCLGLTYLNVREGYGLTEGMRAIRPDILIVDSGWRGLLVSEIKVERSGFDYFKWPRSEFNDFLLRHGELLSRFSDQWHGEFQIYRVLWDNKSGYGPQPRR